ncbi:MAG: hypothetical protein LC774_11520 [Acidobacteria bacterium]|nr:hypothetical protein [Acidobacteriota bacterium]
MTSSDEIQMKAQRSLQEYEDAVENLDPRFAELGRSCVAALDEFIAYWNERPESPASRGAHDSSADEGGAGGESDMTEYVERQLEWARHERERVLSQLSKEPGGTASGR